MDHLATQVMIGVPADPSEFRLIPCRVLSRNQADPGGKLASAAEMSPVINTGDKRSRDDGTNSR
jgi:hypothetical protein